MLDIGLSLCCLRFKISLLRIVVKLKLTIRETYWMVYDCIYVLPFHHFTGCGFSQVNFFIDHGQIRLNTMGWLSKILKVGSGHRITEKNYQTNYEEDPNSHLPSTSEVMWTLLGIITFLLLFVVSISIRHPLIV